LALTCLSKEDGAPQGYNFEGGRSGRKTRGRVRAFRIRSGFLILNAIRGIDI